MSYGVPSFEILATHLSTFEFPKGSTNNRKVCKIPAATCISKEGVYQYIMNNVLYGKKFSKLNWIDYK